MNYKFITMLMLTGVMGSTQAGDHAEAVSKSRGGMLSPRNRAGSTIDSEMVILAGRARAGSQPIEIKSLNLSVMAGQEYDEAGYVEPGAPRAESRLSSGFSDDSKAWAWPEVDAIIDSEVSVPNRLYPETSPDSSRSTTATPRLTSPWAFASTRTPSTLPSFASAPVRIQTASPTFPAVARARSMTSVRSISPDSKKRLEKVQETLAKINLDLVDLSACGASEENKPAAQEVLMRLKTGVGQILAGQIAEQEFRATLNHPRVEGILFAAGERDVNQAQELLFVYVRGMREEVVRQKKTLVLPGKQTTVADLCLGAYGVCNNYTRAQLGGYLGLKNDSGQPKALGSDEILTARQIQRLVLNPDTGLDSFQIRGIDFNATSVQTEDYNRAVPDDLRAKMAVPIAIPTKFTRK